MREPLDGPGARGRWPSTRSTRRSRWPTTATTASAPRCGRPTATRACGSRASCTPGMVWLNDHLPGPTVSRGPWGAAAGGGLGRTLGEAGLRACAQEKLITWDPPATRGLWWGPYDETTARAARAVAKLRSAREADRERAWREGALALARVGARALGRGLPRCGARPPTLAAAATLEACPPRPMQARSASASCAGGSATRAACRGCSTPPSTSPA